MAAAGDKSNTTATAALVLLLLPLMLSSTVSDAARQLPGQGKWEAPIIYPRPQTPWNPPIIYPTPQTPWNPPVVYPSPIKPPPHSGGHLDVNSPSVDERVA
ncbi:hypothetical protein GQ55_3G091300 [Panicum hallii var. hallii]|jgi:hypothetical protein|uniref:Uncharacterized protein n=2 Tax=Panicum hallii TaxID=206008 RepID=A0A2T7E7C2_9POAL|nr:hypothetical protein PAHAL_3G097100 [Panicum hallii]PUZ63732.1 hypothetical protein GQ55_3G091300 [Panicum hallii var. hallii]